MKLSRLAAVGTFADQAGDPADDDTVTITLPDDLALATDEELTSLRDQIIEAFNSLKEQPRDASTLETIKQLRDAKTVLDGELTQRAETAAAIEKEIAEIDAEINGAPVADESAPADAELEPAAAAAEVETFANPDPFPPKAAPDAAPAAPAGSVPADVVVKAGTAIADAANGLVHAAGGGSAPAAAAAADVATFSQKPLVGKVMPKQINVGSLAARTNARATVDVDVAETQANLFTAAVNVPGYVPGQNLSISEVADALHNAMRSASGGAVRASMAAGQRFSQRYPIAQLNKPRSGVQLSEGTEITPQHDAIKFATDESRLPNGSLVAAGGWCAPSETVYDLCALESTDGLVSLPEISVNRGGIRFTQGPDWAVIFESTGFCFTEADDIAGIYGGNEVQQIVVGTGVTAFTLATTLGAGGTTGSLVVANLTPALISTALQNLAPIGQGNVYVTGPAGPAPTLPATYLVQYVNALGDTNVPQLTAPTQTGGTVTITTTTGGDAVVSGKPCQVIPCPPFTDVRLNVCGVCITGANLQNTAYPELTQRYLRGALTAHAHRLNTQIIASMILQSTPVTVATGLSTESAATAPILEAIEYQVEDMKYRVRMSRNQTIEAIFPFWVRALIRADLSRRAGYMNGDSSFGVTDADINGWFAARGVNAQFVYDWQNLGGFTPLVGGYPTTLQFLLFPAGTFVKGTQDIITLEMLHDSTLNATNNFTAIFTEEAWSVMKMCNDARVVSLTICAAGGSNIGTAITCTSTGG